MNSGNEFPEFRPPEIQKMNDETKILASVTSMCAASHLAAFHQVRTLSDKKVFWPKLSRTSLHLRIPWSSVQ